MLGKCSNLKTKEVIPRKMTSSSSSSDTDAEEQARLKESVIGYELGSYIIETVNLYFIFIYVTTVCSSECAEWLGNI